MNKKWELRKKNTLQLKITGIVGLILLAACLLLTANSLFSAQNYYGDYALLIQEGVNDYASLVEAGIAEYDSGYDPDDKLPVLAENSTTAYRDASMKFSVQSVTAMAVIILLALAATYWASGRTLRPLKQLIESVKNTDDQNLDNRVASEGVHGEVLLLNEAFNDMLERLEDAFLIQKSFAANAAHELKTPLAVIKSSLQVLEMTPNPEQKDYEEFMENTGKSLDRIIKTVDGLLSLANLAEVPVDQDIELSSLLKQAVQEMSGSAEKTDVEIVLTCENEISVHGNPDLLYRAVFNLVENAVKYNIPGGKVLITLTADDQSASIRVSDSGIGIPTEALGHIFEPFYRADPSRSQKIPGYGLGLATVKMIADRHGGQISVESTEGSGTAFTLLLNISPA